MDNYCLEVCNLQNFQNELSEQFYQSTPKLYVFHNCIMIETYISEPTAYVITNYYTYRFS